MGVLGMGMGDERPRPRATVTASGGPKWVVRYEWRNTREGRRAQASADRRMDPDELFTRNRVAVLRRALKRRGGKRTLSRLLELEKPRCR